MRPRRPYISCSVRRLMSSPKTETVPWSGRTSPRAVFSSTVLPLPAAPRITRVSPARILNDRPSSAGVSSNRTLTPSNRRMHSLDWPAIVLEIHIHPGDHEIQHKHPDRSHHHGLRG